MLTNLLSALCVLLLVGAAFGAAGVLVRRRSGRPAVLALWVGAAMGLAAIGTVRSARLEEGFHYQRDDTGGKLRGLRALPRGSA